SGSARLWEALAGVPMTVTDPNNTLAIRSLLRRPSLTAERERSLLKACSSSDDAGRQPARSELWQNHSKLAVAVARQYQRPDVPLADLVAAGQRGLYAAIDNYDPDKDETRLANYAIGWIRRYIQDYVEKRAGGSDDTGSPAQIQLLRSASRLFADARRACER